MATIKRFRYSARQFDTRQGKYTRKPKYRLKGLKTSRERKEKS